jgi:hypothetical protein
MIQLPVPAMSWVDFKHAVCFWSGHNMRAGYPTLLSMREMFLSRSFSDVEFQVEGECFPAHKAILSGRSVYFRLECFRSNIIE